MDTPRAAALALIRSWAAGDRSIVVCMVPSCDGAARAAMTWDSFGRGDLVERNVVRLGNPPSPASPRDMEPRNPEENDDDRGGRNDPSEVMPGWSRPMGH